MDKPNFVYNGDIEKDMEEGEHIKLPPMPTGLRPVRDDELKYTGDLNDMYRRLFFKVYSIWLLWVSIRTSKDIEELLARTPIDTDGDEMKAKSIIVEFVDQLGKRLGDTNIMEECAYLDSKSSPQEKM